MTTHTYTATDELDRRAQNRKLAKAGLPKDPAPRTPDGARLMHLTAAELRAEAGIVTPERKTPAVKAQARKAPERTPEQAAATEARKQAWAWRMAERKAGRKVTYTQACAKFGTTPAKAQ